MSRRREAYGSMDPVDMNKGRQVTAGFSELVNDCTEMVRAAISVAGLRPPDRKFNASADYRALAGAGGISRGPSQAFIALKRTRNHRAHIYIDVSAEEVHEAVLALLAELPGFIRGLRRVA